MRILRKFAVQGHPVPEAAYHPMGPFSPEVLARPTVSHSTDTPDSADLPRVYRCTGCGTVLTWDDTTDHDCEDI